MSRNSARVDEQEVEWGEMQEKSGEMGVKVTTMEERRMKWVKERWLGVIENILRREMEENLRNMGWMSRMMQRREIEKKQHEIKKTLEEKVTLSETEMIWRKLEEKLRELQEERMRKVKEELKSMKHEDAQIRIELIEKFVKEFEKEKLEIEKLLTELCEIADGLDKVDRDCIIAKTAGSSAGVVGGVLTIVGIALAPVTFGTSLGLVIAGTATAVAGTVTSGGAQIVNHVSDGNANKRVMEILEIIHTKIIVLCKSCKTALPLCDWNIEEADLTAAKTCLCAAAAAAGLANDAAVAGATDAVLHAAVSLDAVACVNPNLSSGDAEAAVSVAAAGAAVANGGRVLASLIDDAAAAAVSAGRAATVVVKSTGRVVGGIASGVFIVWDAVLIGLNTIKLHEGSPTERAQEIRKLVESGELELAKLEEVNSDIKNILCESQHRAMEDEIFLPVRSAAV
ncbi:apolipoprotein L4-like [Polyodon spathula]|uniref:apolipoprotein L4-like n=1 Tax=Polyodon spathula TaxID=7913 RepID=UPI001B7EC358|nr:apolipoprotein L4-like [Polyodon spathula]